MSSPAVLPSLLSALPPRPPTPPREAHHEAAVAPTRPSLGYPDTRLSLHTPPGLQSPASSTTTQSTSRRIQKRVGFSALAEYKDPPVYADRDGARPHPTPVSLPRSASKPVKSILKVTSHAPNLLGSPAGHDLDSSSPQVSLAAMLESAVQQLAGGDRDSKVDAYLMLTRALKASNNLPDRVALQEKMVLFTQFIQRDLVAGTAEGNPDTSLINHALNLLNTFLHFPAIASTISNDFGVFLVDHCIRSLGDGSTPKDTARRLMQAISLQTFSPKVMTSERVGRLVASLHDVEEHLKGKSIVLSRILIYRKLVQQSRQLMIVHSDWLLDMFTDMLSTLRDTRAAAISLGLEAAFSIGHEKQLSRKVMDVFSLAYEDRLYIQYYEEKLKAMAKDKHESAVVPEIWSVVILLLRVRLDKWEFAGRWLHIIQDCFNSADFPTKVAANHAWARLVYLMHLEERAFPKNLATLTTPLVSQLRRKGHGKTSEDLRLAVLGGICNLFYYAFKPGTSPTLLDTYWDTSVSPILAKMLDPPAEAAHDNLRQAAAILTGLCDCTTLRRWRVDRVVEKPLVKPEELPPLDSKWIRRNTGRVFGVVEPILQQDFLSLASTDSATSKLWRALVSTVASAAAKEIKVARDTMIFLGEALRVLRKIWKQGLPGKDGASQNEVPFLHSVRAYLEILIGSLGLLPFTEKTGKHQTPAKAPLHALFSMLSALPPGVADGKDFADFLSSVFAPFFTSKAGRARMDLAQDLLSGIPMDAPRPYGTWLLVAENVMSWLDPGHNSHQSTGSGEIPVGLDFRDIVKLLERGIRSTPNLPREHWVSLFYAVFERIRDETGDAGVAIVLIEPLAKLLVDQCAFQATSDSWLAGPGYLTELVSVATHPRDRQAVDAARKRLWGTALAGSRSSSFDPLDCLYKAASDALGHFYVNFGRAGADHALQLLKEIADFFDRCNPQLFLRAMVSLEDGLLPWIQDSKRLLGSQSSPVFTAVKLLWEKLAHLITCVEHPELQLQYLERFFCASFASCHRAIVNSAISLWNRVFENVGHLDYPGELKAALVRMQLHADIVLPGLETLSVENAGQHLSFVDSFDDLSLPQLPSTRSSSRRATPRPTSSQSKVSTSHRLGEGRLDNSPPREPAQDGVHKTLTRLRHDDSQVQFALIDPLGAERDGAVESQILTERQKEVRERQRENAALLPAEMRPSSGAMANAPDRQMHTAGPRVRQATTPEPERAFDEYVSSTPTPRRGQLPVMLDQDMTDPPSSPPEPRGNPLAAEIRSRSASHSLLEEWQFSSSPVSGSPNANRHSVVSEASVPGGYVTVVSLPEVHNVPHLAGAPVGETGEEQSQSPTDDIIEDSMVFEPVAIPPAPAPAPALASHSSMGRRKEVPFTPRRSTRISRSRAHETPTPKSDGEVYVDAPTSPLPRTPKHAERAVGASETAGAQQAPVITTANTSFDMSDVDERSLLRLVVELDSGKIDRSQYHRTSPSVSPAANRQGSPVADCIVVGESPQKAEQPMPCKRPRASLAVASALSSSIESISGSGSQPRGRSGRQKRKRTLSKGDGTSPKRQRHGAAEQTAELQGSEAAARASHAEAEAQATEIEICGSGEVEAVIPGVDKTDELQEERIPSSAEFSSSSSLSQEGSSDESAAPELENALNADGDVDVGRDDQDVQSQIALELSHRQPEEGQCGVASKEPLPIFVAPDELMRDVGVQTLPITSIEDERTEEVAAAEKAAKQNTDAEAPAVPEMTQAQKILDLFRSGLDELRSARLSRQEVYQIEDMFMDMKRELYEAERRGRA